MGPNSMGEVMVDFWGAAVAVLGSGALAATVTWRYCERRLSCRAAQWQADAAGSSARVSDWEQFADKALPLFPVLVRQIGSVIADTELATGQLSERFQQIARNAIELTKGPMEMSGGGSGVEGGCSMQQILTEMDAMLARFVKDVGNLVEMSSRAVRSVGEVNTLTKSVTAMLSDLEFMADQSSMLALNAAIEAAHAGDQGRGFAVVADEVGKLAKRSAGVSSSIRSLVTAIHTGMGHAQTAMTEVAGLSASYATTTCVVQSKVNDFTATLCRSNAELDAGVQLAVGLAKGLAQDLSQVVMSLQFQDIVRQKLEHVADPLQRVEQGLVRLRVNGGSGEACKALPSLSDLEATYTMASERRVSDRVIAPNGEEGPVYSGDPSSDSVTLF